MQVSIDPQATGWRDDGTDGGIVRTELARAGYVQMPFRNAFQSTSAAGSASIGLNGGNTNNTDGSGTRIAVSVAASATLENYAYLGFWIQGNVFGLRHASLPGPIDCMIDGVAYTVEEDTTLNSPRTGFTSGSLPAADYQILARDLGEGLHWVELTFPAFLSGATRSYLLFGYIVDGRAGYVRPSGYVHIHQEPVAITATTGATGQFLAVSPAATTTSYWGMRSVLLCNTTAGAITVSAVYSTRTSTPIWTKSVPANDTVIFDLGGIIADVNNLYFYASGAGINATPIGVG